jgi:integrase/recombinase XerD
MVQSGPTLLPPPSIANRTFQTRALDPSSTVHAPGERGVRAAALEANPRSGVDINTIRAWLGHVSLDTTHIYAEVDLEMKAKALALCDLPTLPLSWPRRASNGPKWTR